MKKILSVLLAVAILCMGLIPCVGAKDADTYDNVILMIGDGMGGNHLALAKQERGIKLFMEDKCDLRGYSETRSFSSKVTDSAAGGTALSSGVRTVNRYVASYWYDPLCWFSMPRTLAEAAKLSGRRSGVITTDTTDGATPASFSAHTSDRGNSTDISTQQAKSDLDLIWGGAVSTFSADLAAMNGFTVLTTAREMNALQPGSKSFAQFDYETMWHVDAPEGSTSPTLSEMTEKAIELLDNDNGFFLMVEGAHIDKFSHTNKAAEAAEALEEFDHAIEIAANFAKEDGNTLVVITADHETGGITLQDGKYVYTTTSHTGADVPLIVFGSNDFIENGRPIQNREVAQRIGKKMGLDRFPASDPGKITAYFRNVTDLLTRINPGTDVNPLLSIRTMTRDLFASLFPKK